MNNKEIQLVSDFILNAKRTELESALFTILSEWPYEKAKAFCRSAVIQIQINELEALKNGG